MTQPDSSYYAAKHRVLIVADGALDYFVLPTTLSAYGEFKKLREAGKSVPDVLEYAKEQKIPVKVHPGGPALTIGQYLAKELQEPESHVREVSALLCLGATSHQGDLLTDESIAYKKNFEVLGIDIRARLREGTLPRALYVCHPTISLEMERFWEGNIARPDEKEIDMTAYYDFVRGHDTMVIAATHPDVACKAAEYFGGDLLVYNPGPVLGNHEDFADTHFDHIVRKAHLLSLNRREARTVINQLGLHPGGKTRGFDVQDYESMKRLFDAYDKSTSNLEWIVVTMGAQGALWLSRNGTGDYHYDLNRAHGKVHAKDIKDTVGAGDAHLAGVLLNMWSGKIQPGRILQEAGSLAQQAVTHRSGVNPKYLKLPEGGLFDAVRKLEGNGSKSS